MKNLSTINEKSNCSRATSAWLDFKERTTISSREHGDSSYTPHSKEHEPKQKIIPRAGRMKFLSSVLTILSKASTATQCPDLDDPPLITKSLNKRDKKSKKKNVTNLDATKKNSKYSSRKFSLEDDLLDLVLLQQTKPEALHSSVEDIDAQKQNNNTVMKLNNTITGNSVVNKKSESIKKPGNDLKDSGSEFGYDRETDPVTQVAQEYNDNNSVYTFFLDIIQSSLNPEKSKQNLLADSKMSLTNTESSKLYLDMKECLADTLDKTKNVKKKRSKKLSIKSSSPSVKMTLDDADFLDANVSTQIERRSKPIPIYNKKVSEMSTKSQRNKIQELIPPSVGETPLRTWKAPCKSEISLRKWKARLINDGPLRKFTPPRKGAAPLKRCAPPRNKNGSPIRKLKCPHIKNEKTLMKFRPLRIKTGSPLLKLKPPSPPNKNRIITRKLINNNKKDVRMRENQNKLFNILKDELSNDNPKYNREPRNFYQSLKIVGKNKILGERAIRFDNTVNKVARPLKKYDGVVTKKPTVTNKSKKHRKPKVTDVYALYETGSGFNAKSRCTFGKHENVSEHDSHLSIEVEGYNYRKRCVKNEDIYRFSNVSLLGGSSTASKDDTKYIPQWYIDPLFQPENT